MQEIRRQAELTHRQASPIFCYLEFRGKVKKSGKEKGSTKNGWGKRGGEETAEGNRGSEHDRSPLSAHTKSHNEIPYSVQLIYN